MFAGTKGLPFCVVVSVNTQIRRSSMTALSKRKSAGGAAQAILWGGLIAGAIDISFAAVMTATHGGQPLRMLQGIAYALIGPSAFKGSWGTAVVGLLCHFAIAFGAAAAYYLVSRFWSVMVREPIVCGLLYGVPVYWVTNFVIVPMSKIGRVLPGNPDMLGMAFLMIGVGVPIALMTRRYSK
jgi:hypothetical protein